MAKKTFQGRPLLPGNLEGKAMVSKGPFNTTGSYLENMFAGNSETAPCTDPNNKDLFGNDLPADFIVDVSSTFETKKQALACHDSQRAWLMKQHGITHHTLRWRGPKPSARSTCWGSRSTSANTPANSQSLSAN